MNTEGDDGIDDDEVASTSSNVDLRSDILLLASSKIDAVSPSSRDVIIREATKVVTEDGDAQKEIGSGLGIEAADACNSTHAYRRLLNLYIAALFEVTTEKDVNLGICRAVCHLLIRSKSTDLMQVCYEHLTDSKLSNDPIRLDMLIESFLDVARAGETAKSKGEYAPALSLLSHLISIRADEGRTAEWRKETMDIFLKRTLTGGNFAHGSEITICTGFLRGLKQEEFDRDLAPVLGMKLRANPESVLETVVTVLSAMVSDVSTERVDVTAHLEGETKLLPSAMRQVRSAKPEMRTLASSMLVSLALLSPSIVEEGPMAMVVSALAESLSGKKPASALTLPDQRLGAYCALQEIGESVARRIGDDLSVLDITENALESSADVVLCGLSSALSKETGGAGIEGSTAKKKGFDALMTWMQLSKRIGGKSGGYGSAVTYLSKPAVDATKPGSSSASSEFRYRIGSLLALSNDDFIESVIVDLFQEKKFESGLQSIIDHAVKKHAASDIVPQVDGLVALFVLLTFTAASSSSSLSSLPPSVSKALSVGSSIKGNKSSFVYCKATTDASATDVLVGRVLPRVIALYCKTLSKERDDEGPANDVVCLVGEKGEPSAGARALACCVANPHPFGATAPSAAIISSLKTVLTYSSAGARAADALLRAIFNHVNARSAHFSEVKLSLNESREARELFEPINQNYTKLPFASIKGKCSATASHQGYDPNTVRRVANILSRSTSDVESLSKAMVLSHAGTTMKGIGRQREALVTNTIQLLRDTILPLVKRGEDSALLLGKLADFVSLCASTYERDLETVESDNAGDDTAKTGTKEQKAVKGKKDKINSAERLTSVAGQETEKFGDIISAAVHESALSLLTTLGGIAGNCDPEYDDPDDEETQPYAFARKFCVEEMPSRFARSLTSGLTDVESLSAEDLALYKSPKGVLYRDGSSDSAAAGSAAEQKIQNVDKKRAVKSRKTKGDFGAGFEEEEWERQMKKELAEKKRKEESATKSSAAAKAAAAATLSPEEKKLLSDQDRRRDRLCAILDGNYPRVLAAIQCLCLSDIEVGNSCLPDLAGSVISAVVSNCEAIRSLVPLHEAGFTTLSTLAACVYEIDESHASTVARALAISYRRAEPTASLAGVPLSGAAKSEKKSLTVSALPSPCAPAACAIFEMDDYGDCLSGQSFVFLFPILRAALAGPRTAPGCEAALQVVNRHTIMIAGDEADPSVTPLRKEMASTVLELLSHDRSQTFIDPTPFDALVACYITADDDGAPAGPVLTTSELAPLLGEHGALGGKNCRIGAMIALGSIASKHPRLVKNNPLIENRIWVNCYAQNESIRNAARKTWMIANGVPNTYNGEGEENAPLPSPSKMYAIPLLPLLSHADESIAISAAGAFAHAMGMHPDSIERNIVKLCNTHISSFPKVIEAEKIKPSSMPAPVKKKSTKISTGLPTKKPSKKSSVGGTTIGKLTSTKTATKKRVVKTVSKAPSKERTFDKELLESQFGQGSSKKDDDADKDNQSKVSVRLGVLRVIAALTDTSAHVELDISVLKLTVGFLMAYGLADGNEEIRGSARNAARDVVATNGSSDEAIAFLLPHFESVLSTGKADESCLGSLPTEKVPRDVTASDRRKEGAVVALGSVALHLKGEENADKIDSTVDMLISALQTPSEGVQSSVALCLSKLMKKGRTQERVESILAGLMKECLHGEKLASRRGAAYGISAVVKGSGIASLKKYEIVKQLEEACTDGPSTGKEGALFAIELLSERLGLLFEPYVIVLLPALLKAFSDSNDHVRAAASQTAGLIMSKLSTHGVKLVMPAVLSAFDEPAWRTKQAAIYMLGSMSHLAPRQLASSLPKVVPKLTEAFSDTHPKVKASAEDALNEISKVIKNPEISSISPVLLKALTDPATGTVRALEALIETEFLHAIDAPSLALIVPVLHRGLRDRTATTKRYAALIAGNICTMINDPRDFVPYLPILLPDLKAVLLDPIPDVRSTSAKALGSLTRGLGEATFPDLRPWLIDTLKDENGSSVERSGAAQGLTEVLIAGGAHVVDSVMREEILPLRSHPKASTREGVLWVLTFLPTALGQAFTPLIDASLPALLSGLSDESEPVRDVAMRAGRVLIRSHGKAHVDKILPSLEAGLSDEDYRIRVASLTLLGDLLSMIGGTTVVKGDADSQDDIRRAERAQAQIALVLGSGTRKRVLAGLYLARSDTVAVVRVAAVQVWKTVVSVTPRTLREILPVLVEQIVTALASGDPERTQVAGRCLGDIVSKLGDSVLPELIPVLRDALYKGDRHTRRGVCVGLTEVIGCSSKEQISKFLHILVKVVQDALCDEDEGVRQMAASCFQSLHAVVGNRALDEVVPVLLVAMESGDDDEVAKARALNGLTGILSIRSRELLPYLVPRLLQKPITKSHADALGSIANVTGATIHMHFNTIIPALLSELASFDEEDMDESEKEREEAVRGCSRSICGNVEETGVNWLVGEVASKCGSDKDSLRKECCWMFEVIVTERKDEQDFYEQIPIILRELIYRLNDENPVVLKATNSTLKALSSNVPAEELVKHIEFIRNLIASMVSDSRRRKGGVGDGEFLLPGFNMPKGLEPLLPIYQRGILYGNSTIREVSAAGLGELISITSNKYLAGPFIIKMTGPLLRIVGDRNPSAVKIAIIQTLGLILTKGGPALRAFVPQFQTTFVKALSDPSRQVRVEAIKALALLMPLSTRLDPLIKELVQGSLGKGPNTAVETAGVVAIQTATLDALAGVLKHGGKKAKLPDSIPSALDAGKELLFHEDDGVREGAAKVIGASCDLLGVDVTQDVVKELIVEGVTNDSSDAKHGRACVCHRILASSVGKDVNDNLFREMVRCIKSLMRDEKSTVREAACVAVGAALGSASDSPSCLEDVEASILKAMDSSEIMEVHKALARGLCIAVRMKPRVFAGEEGLPVMDGALKLAMSGSQRVQLAFNDFLWLALNVVDGESGLEEYMVVANFENSRTMKTLHSKVLVRMKGVEDED